MGRSARTAGTAGLTRKTQMITLKDYCGIARSESDTLASA